MTRIHLLVNPAAGGGTAGTKASDVETTLRAQGLDVVTTLTRDADHAIQYATTLGVDDVLAPLGGDGMIALVTRGIMDLPAPQRPLLLPLPAGRGNDFIRALGLPHDTQRVSAGVAAALSAPHRQVRTIDVGLANGLPFLGVLSIGFDADATARANRMTRLTGAAVYTVAGIAQTFLAKRSAYDLTVEAHAPSALDTDGGPQSRPEKGSETIRAWNIAVGNSGRFGGGLRVCPDARLDDGLLDLVTCAGRRAEFAAAALLYRGGHHTHLPHVESRTVSHLTVTSTQVPDAPVYADGDQITTLPATMTVAPAAIRVLVPLG